MRVNPLQKTVAIIPARYSSTRFPGKPLADIAGKPMIQHVWESAKQTPSIDQILVETDSPYLAPPPYRGKRNEPAYVTLTAQKGAEIFNLSYEHFANQIEQNFERLFPKARTQRPVA